MKLVQTEDYLLLINEEAEIKEADLVYEEELDVIFDIQPYGLPCNNIKTSKIITYYPLNSEAKELDLPLLPEHDIEGFRIIQSKQFSLEDVLNLINEIGFVKITSEELNSKDYQPFITDEVQNIWTVNKEHLLSHIQSLSTQQLPKEFIPEYEDVFNKTDSCSILDNNYHTHSKKLKTITNSEGKEILVGTYKY